MKQFFLVCALLTGFAIGSHLGTKSNYMLKESYALFLKQIKQVDSINKMEATQSHIDLVPPSTPGLDEDPNLTQHN